MRKFILAFVSILLIFSPVSVRAEGPGPYVPAEEMSPALSTIRYYAVDSIPYNMDDVLGAAYSLDSLRGKGNNGVQGSIPSYALLYSQVTQSDPDMRLFLYVGNYDEEAGTPHNIWNWVGYYFIGGSYDLVYMYDEATLSFIPATSPGSNNTLSVNTERLGPFKAGFVYLGPTIVSDASGDLHMFSPKPWAALEDTVFKEEVDPPPSGIVQILLQFLETAIETLKIWFSMELDRLMSWIDAIVGVIDFLLGGILSAVEAGFGLIGDMIMMLYDVVAGILQFIKDLIIPTTTWSQVTQLFSDLFDGIKNSFKLMFDAFGMLAGLFTDLMLAPAATRIDFPNVEFFGNVVPVYVDFSMMESTALAPVFAGIRVLTGSFLTYGIALYIRRLYDKFIDGEGE